MAIKNLPGYRDLRGSLRTKGSYNSKPLSNKTQHVIHHSLTPTGSASAYNNYHIDDLGWPGIGYHFVIEKDGTINQCHDLNKLTYHVGNSNGNSIGTCLTGDFRKGKQVPTQAQRNSLNLLNRALYSEVGSLKRTIGHQECPGYSWKNCPGDNWNYKQVIAGSFHAPSVPQVGNVPNSYTVQSGDTLWQIAKSLEGVTVDSILSLNPGLVASKLSVGQVIKLSHTPVGGSYTIQKGDTLWGIARSYSGVEVSHILNANPGLIASKLKVGQRIVIPGVSSTVTPIVTPSVTPPISTGLPTGILRSGDKGVSVISLQNALNKVYFRCNVSGIFDASTKDALTRFQKVYLPYEVDGIYGPKSRAALVKKI